MPKRHRDSGDVTDNGGMDPTNISEAKMQACEIDGDNALSECYFECDVDGCTYICYTHLDFEAHYRCCHSHRCSSCGAVFSSYQLLEDHIDIFHNVFRRTTGQTSAKS